MLKNFLRSVVAALVMSSMAFGTAIAPAKADTTTTLLITAAAAIGLMTAVNVAQKNAKAHQVVGYLPNGAVVYADGHVVNRNGQSWYPGNYGENIACNGQQCYITGGNGAQVGYGNAGYPGAYPSGYYGGGYPQQAGYPQGGYYGGYPQGGYYGGYPQNGGYYGGGTNRYYPPPPAPPARGLRRHDPVVANPIHVPIRARGPIQEPGSGRHRSHPDRDAHQPPART
jgi:hypothetical protein